MFRVISFEVIKLLKLWIKDPKIILGGLIAPLVILLAFYLMFGTLPPFKIGVINEDNGRYGDKLIQELKSTENPAGTTYFRIYQKAGDSLEKMYSRDNLVAVLTIPVDFSKKVREEKSPELIYQINNYNTDFAKNLRLYLDEVLLQFYNHNYSEININITEKYEAEQYDWFKTISLSVIVLSFILGGCISAMYFYQKEMISNTITNYSLISYNSLVFLLPRYILSVLIALLSGSGTYLAVFLLNGPIDGILLAAVIAILGAVPYIGLGLIVYKILKKYMSAAIITMITAIITWFLGGSLGPSELKISKVFPVYYTNYLVRDTLLYNDYSNFTKNLIVLLAFALTTFMITVFVHHRSRKL